MSQCVAIMLFVTTVGFLITVVESKEVYQTAHGHKVEIKELSSHCQPEAMRLCIPHYHTADFSRNVIISAFFDCVLRKRSMLPPGCDSWVNEHEFCAEDLARLCPDKFLADTLSCVDQKYMEVSQRCKESWWYQHHFKLDNERVSYLRHHYDDDDEHPLRHTPYKTPDDVHETGEPDL